MTTLDFSRVPIGTKFIQDGVLYLKHSPRTGYLLARDRMVWFKQSDKVLVAAAPKGN